MTPGRFVVSEYSRADEYQYCQRCGGGLMHKICCLNMLEIFMVARKSGRGSRCRKIKAGAVSKTKGANAPFK
jgi:hypothetical protein